MKTLAILFLTFTASGFDQNPDRPIVEAMTDEDSKMGPFSVEVFNEVLLTFVKIEKSKYSFLRRSIDTSQKGLFTTSDGIVYQWQFDHCEGLRLKKDGHETRYFAPPVRPANQDVTIGTRSSSPDAYSPL